MLLIIHQLLIQKYDLDTYLDLDGFWKKLMVWKELDNNFCAN